MKHWKHIAILVGIGLLAVIINTKTKGKIQALIAQIPVVGPMLS